MEMVDRTDVEIFVEKNTEYYGKIWASLDDAENSRVSWNWAAAIGGLVWMLYRKLYALVAFATLAIVIDSFVTIELEEAQIFPMAVAVWDKFSYWVYAAVFGSWGNYWYFRQFRKAKNGAAELFVDQEEQRKHLARKGGTNLLVAGLFAVSASALLVWAILEP